MLYGGIDSFIETESKMVDIGHWAGEDDDLGGQGSMAAEGWVCALQP